MSQGPAILVVDDSSAMRNLISHHLSREGYVVTGAANSRDALEHCRTSVPDLVIMDLELNNESGLDLIHRFQCDANLIQIPIIACSGNTDPVVRQKALQTGARCYLVKNETLRREILVAIKSHLAIPCSAR